MFHTAELSIQLEQEHLRFKKAHYGELSINEVLYSSMINEISIVEISTKPLVFCTVVVNVYSLLNKGNVEESDYEQVERHIRRALTLVYGDNQLFDQHNLSRIDYCFDVEVLDEHIRTTYLELFKKLKNKRAYLKKEIHLTSQYHHCKSIHLLIYDREQERRDQNEPIETWERGMLRFKVCVKRDHLKYKKYKKGESRLLKDYFKKEKFEKYVKNYMLDVFPIGDFYSYQLLEEEIYKLDLSIRVKSQMKAFVKFVSKGSLDTAAKNFSAKTYRKYLDLFNEHGINPITIPPKYKIEHLESLVKQAIL